MDAKSIEPRFGQAAKKYARELQDLDALLKRVTNNDLDLLPHVLGMIADCCGRAAAHGKLRAQFRGDRHGANMLGGVEAIMH